MEVLAASMVLAIALTAIATTVSVSLRKAKSPGQMEAAALLASERLNYYRSQEDPYRAAGGTHYTDPDVNRIQAAHNVYNGNPRLFVREYLYGLTANEIPNAAVGSPDVGLANQRRRALLGQDAGNWARNQVPATPPGVSRVIPNVNGTALNPVPGAIAGAPAGLTQVAAPKANGNIAATNGGPIPPDIKFVREVWVQSSFPASMGVPTLGTLVDPWFQQPAAALRLPHYTVAVTVKVFARDPKTSTFSNTVVGGAAKVRNNDYSGPGYDSRKPLAQMIGYFGLRRILQ